MSDNGNENEKSMNPEEFLKGLKDLASLKILLEYAEKKESIPEGSKAILSKFLNTLMGYVVDTFAIDPMRLRTQRVFLLMALVIQGAYLMGAANGTKDKEG
jgi:hypothetical protein